MILFRVIRVDTVIDEYSLSATEECVKYHDDGRLAVSAANTEVVYAPGMWAVTIGQANVEADS